VLLDNKLAGNFREAYLEQLHRHDLYVLPAIRDRHGTDEAGPALTMVCAQASGLPVISTKFPGAEISVIEGESGLYCEEKDSDSIVEKILQLIRDPDLRARMGKRGSEIAMREFSECGQMEKLMEIYRDVAGRSPVDSKARVETDGDKLRPLDRYRIPEIGVIQKSEVGEF
jgi:glycosyltransferase involved in cell wall biosynthesis